jgi:hypothetical protein
MLSLPLKLLSPLKNIALVLACCWFFRLDLVFKGHVTIGAVGVDSDQYLSYLNTILGSTLSFESQITSFTPAILTRTPGYPLFLVLAVMLGSIAGSFAQGLILAHAVVWVSAAFVFAQTVGRDLGVRKSLVIFLVASLIIRPLAFQLMSDWLAIMIASVSCCYLWAFTQKGRAVDFFVSIFCASCATIVRPDYLILVCIVAVGGVLAPVALPSFRLTSPRSLLFAGITGVVPLGMLLGWNALRFGDIVFIPREGHLYELASILGPEPQLELDAAGQALLNARQAPPQQATTSELLGMITLEPHALNSIALRNLGILEAAQARSGVSWLEANRALAAISKRYLETYPERYALAILCGISSLLWGVPAYLMIGISFVKRHTAQSLFGLVVCIFHVLHVGGVSAVHIMHARYYLPSASLLILGALVCLFSKSRPTHAG